MTGLHSGDGDYRKRCLHRPCAVSQASSKPVIRAPASVIKATAAVVMMVVSLTGDETCLAEASRPKTS